MKNFIFIILSFYSFSGIAQDTLSVLESPKIKDSLVALALKNYPATRIRAAEINYAKRNLNLARLSWTQNLRVFYNLNDQMYNNNVVYNRPVFGAGLSLSLGDFISLPPRTKMARSLLIQAHGQNDLEALSIKRDVLSRYNNYLTSLQLYILKTEEVEEAQVLLNNINEKFRKGQASLDDQTRASIFVSQAKEQKFVARNNLMNNKLLIEELIGIPLDDFLGGLIKK